MFRSEQGLNFYLVKLEKIRSLEVIVFSFYWVSSRFNQLELRFRIIAKTELYLNTNDQMYGTP